MSVPTYTQGGITVRKTKSGWVINTTNMVNGMLEQGGVSGREVLYKHATLCLMGIKFAESPFAPYSLDGVITNANALIEGIRPDKVLKNGEVIQ